MDAQTPRGDDEVCATLKRYDERISALEREVEGLKAGRTALAQTPALTTAQPAQTQAYTPAEHQPATINQVTEATAAVTTTEANTATADAQGQPTRNERAANVSAKDDGVPLVLPLIVGALVWFFSGSFVFGAIIAVASSFGIHVLFGANGARKSKSETTDAGQGAAASAGNGGDGEAARGPRVKSNLEQSIGRYWYLWTGVCLLVVGLGYGLMLAYEHVGPLVKIISWFAGAAALVVAGEYAQRKMDFKQFGLALVGGGYAVGYFTIYAMQNIASVKIIDSVVLDSCLLLALAAGCMLHSMYRKAESIALLASLLAFVTLSLSPVTSFTVVASAVMVIGLAAATIYMRWFMVYLAGVIGAYVTFTLFTQPQLAASVTGSQGLLLSFGFLAAYWLVFSLVHLRIRQPEESDGVKRFTISAAILNASAFIVLALAAMGAEFADWRYLFLLFTSAAYGGFAYVARAKNLAFSGTLFTLIALGAATAAVPLWLSPNAVTAVWLLEVPILVVAGLRFRMLELRGFAVAVAVLAVARLFAGDILGLSYQLVTGLTAVFAFAVSGQAYRLKAFEAAQHKYENLYARYFYLAAPAVVAWWMPLVLAGPSTQGLYWALAGVGFMAYAYFTKERVGEYVTAIMLASSAAALLVNYQAVGALSTVANAAVFFAAGAIYRWRLNNTSEEQVLNINFHHAYSVAAVVITWALTALHNQSDMTHLALWLTVESALVVAAGFFMKDRVIRQLGSMGVLGAGATLALSVTVWTWATTLPVVAGLYALSFAYRLVPIRDNARPAGLLDTLALGRNEAEVVQMVSAVAGTLLTTAACYNLLAWQWMAVAWSLEAIALLAIGVKLNDKVFRYSAHAVFALMLAKLVLWDLRGAEQYVRVIIFIVAGVVSIAAAWIFARFEKKLSEEKGTAERTQQTEEK